MPNNTLKMGEKKILEHHGESNSSAIHNAKHFYNLKILLVDTQNNRKSIMICLNQTLNSSLQKPQRARMVTGGNIYKTIKNNRSIFDTFNISC